MASIFLGFLSDSSAPEPAASPDVTICGIHIWLTLLSTINEEMTDRQLQRALSDVQLYGTIKDLMRSNGVVKSFADTWFQLLSIFHDKRADVTIETLTVITSYISWIDIQLIANDRFLPLLLNLSRVPVYQTKVLNCYRELLAKGMARDPCSKLEIMYVLNLPYIFSIESTDPDVVEHIAKMVNITGLEVLGIYRSLTGQDAFDPSSKYGKIASDMFSLCLNSMPTYLSSSDKEVSRSVLEFALYYVKFLKREKASESSASIERVQILIHVSFQQMKYDPSYQFNDSKHEFESFRKEFAALFKHLVQLNSSLVFSYIGTQLTRLPQIDDPFELELILYALCLLTNGTLDQTQSTFLLDAIRLFVHHSCRFLSSDPPPFFALTTQFFLCVSKYSKLLDDAPDLLPPLLVLWTGEYGILHRDPSCRSVHCKEFAHFSKTLRYPLQPYVVDVVVSLKDKLTLQQHSYQVLTFDEQLELLEVLGILMGILWNQTHAKGQDTIQILQLVGLLMDPIEEQIVHVLKKNLYLEDSDSNAFYKAHLDHLIRAFGTFLKGFTTSNAHHLRKKGRRKNKSAPSNNDQTNDPTTPRPTTGTETDSPGPNKADEAQYEPFFEPPPCFERVSNYVLECLESMGNFDIIRSAALFYFHRISVCIPCERLLPLLCRSYYKFLEKPVATSGNSLISMCESVAKYLHFLTKLLAMYDQNMRPLVEAQFPYLFCTVVSLIADAESQVTPKSDEELDLNDFKRQYYLFLLKVIEAGLADVFASNKTQLSDLFNTLSAGCRATNDPVIQKYAFQVCNALASQWLGETKSNNFAGLSFPPNFLTNCYQNPDCASQLAFYLIQHVFPMSLQMVVNPLFHLQDAKTNEVLYEISTLEKHFYVTFQQEFEKLVQHWLLALVPNCTETDATQYIHALRATTTVNQFKSFKLKFLTYYRSL
ncbi:exportin-T-like [Schistocerca gregaria]|uniref:exportin-T-like n=1 Tax=Schistocerca gregaria TaxID=7010 RepID=UPI00211E85F8|nr:exportin-T-like [Schistocerca gregaria]